MSPILRVLSVLEVQNWTRLPQIVDEVDISLLLTFGGASRICDIPHAVIFVIPGYIWWFARKTLHIGKRLFEKDDVHPLSRLIAPWVGLPNITVSRTMQIS